MAACDNTYSRVVAWLRIALPLLALAILSTLFLLAHTIDPAQNLPYADIDIDELTREQRIGNPQFAAVTADGAAISLSARSARPDPENEMRIQGSDVAAKITLPTGTTLDFHARSMVLDRGAQTAGLGGGVLLKSSAGYALRTDTLTLDLARTRVAAVTEAVVTAPFGTLTSGKFVLTGDGSAAKPYLLVFKDKVRLLYQPGE